MLFRRVSDHLRAQNWLALCLDLLVVVVGVFIAIQVERWYADRGLQDIEFRHLTALQEDFRQTKEDVTRMHERYRMGGDAAIRLLEISRDSTSDISPDDFYNLLGAALRVGRFQVVHRTWNVLTVGGDINVIQNDALKSQISAFFAETEVVLQNYGDAVGMYDLHDEYFINKFDFVEYTRYFHLSELSSIDTNDPPVLPTDVLHSVTFRNIMVSKWHYSYDLNVRLTGLLNRIETIDRMLSEDLLEFDAK